MSRGMVWIAPTCVGRAEVEVLGTRACHRGGRWFARLVVSVDVPLPGGRATGTGTVRVPLTGVPPEVQLGCIVATTGARAHWNRRTGQSGPLPEISAEPKSAPTTLGRSVLSGKHYVRTQHETTPSDRPAAADAAAEAAARRELAGKTLSETRGIVCDRCGERFPVRRNIRGALPGVNVCPACAKAEAAKETTFKRRQAKGAQRFKDDQMAQRERRRNGKSRL